jgi:hypothetical protein
MDKEKQRYFEIDEDRLDSNGIQIHSCRTSLGQKFSHLSIHRDSQNDNDNLCFAPVLVASWLIMVDSVPSRLAIITYSRKFVSETLQKIKKYGPAIRHVTEFYHEMKHKGRAEITKDIFLQNYVTAGNCNLHAARIPPHMDTCVHWSAMGADALIKLNRQYQITYQQGLALLYSVCASNSPDYFRLITNKLLKDKNLGKAYFEKDAVFIAIDCYEMIFSFKKDTSHGKQNLLGQRHQPCANKQGTRSDIAGSLNNLITCCNVLCAWD